MPAPLLLDLSHTSHTKARTGIQRVVRGLASALGESAVGVTFDPYEGSWRRLRAWETANLANASVAAKRGARWPLPARLRGRMRRKFGCRPTPPLPASSGGVIVPELFSPAVANALPALFAAASGPKIALFHDAIALRLPELTPVNTVRRYPAYLIELLQFDGIASVSDESTDALVRYWRWLGIPDPEMPSVRRISPGIEWTKIAASDPARTTVESIDHDGVSSPVALCVGSIEARKNHLALLEACERLWKRGVRLELHVIGLSNAETGAPALRRIRELQAAGWEVRYDGASSDSGLNAAYARCRFTVYPSLMEGFGLPVLESIAHGKPCICSARGALGESTREGGCWPLEHVGVAELEQAIEHLLTNPAELDRLAGEAQRRTVRTWENYVRDLAGWMAELQRPMGLGGTARKRS